MPANGNYLTAAYIVAAVILVGYAAVLWHNSRATRKGENEKTGERRESPSS